MRIAIETESDVFASIEIEGWPRHTLDANGVYWDLHSSTQPAFADPLKRWRRSAKRDSINAVLPEALAFILAMPEGEEIQKKN